VLVPHVDISALVAGNRDTGVVSAESAAAAAIDAACRDTGFFSIVGHGVDPGLRHRLEALAREFFALDDAEKSEIAMARGGRAWRGWFPLGGELTSGLPDRKEGIYFGAELGADDTRVCAGIPLHGPNLFPHRPAALRATVLEYLETMTALGHTVMRGVALALGLAPDWFARELTADPTILFRIFAYPPTRPDPLKAGEDEWGVREHTDYGLLTIVGQDDVGGLQVRSTGGWIDVPPDADAFVCNIGDMLERMTGGRYRSTPHRVRNTAPTSRLSFPFFFDPGWDAEVRALPEISEGTRTVDAQARWDRANVHELTGTYGEYLLSKVSKVFPALTSEL
jgi:isopenicillin N synthase-like dioxygenase